MARIESTERIKNFNAEVSKIDWTDKKAGLQILFEQVNNLVQAEIDYYYQRRIYKRNLTTVFKFFTLLFGTVGALLPLISNTGVVPESYNSSSWGYVLLAVAAACFTADRLFTGTSGHMRYVVAQIKLEEKLTLFRLLWLRKISGWKPEQAQIIADDLFNDMILFISEFYKIIEGETQEWRGELTKVLDDYAKNVKK